MPAVLLRTVMLLLAVLSVTACTTPPRSMLYTQECDLGTNQSNQTPYHALAYYPREHGLLASGMVIGIEKSAEDRVKKPARQIALKDLRDQPEANADTVRWLHAMLTEHPKSMFISHAVLYDKHPHKRNTPHRFIHNLYTPHPHAETAPQASDWKNCERQPVALQADAMQASWQAVRNIRQELDATLSRHPDRYTHVLVMVMGWNTVQTEAVQNFNSLYLALKEAHRDADPHQKTEFRPFVIGVTWPSEWDISWLPEDLVRPASALVKADDADELAAGWLGAVLHQAVFPVTTALHKPVYAIGHSFGARAVTHAVCNGSQYRADPTPGARLQPAVDWLVSLQGAYSLNRFTRQGAGTVDLSYNDCTAARQFLFTASDKDSVGNLGGKFGPPWAGTYKSYQEIDDNGGWLGTQGPRFNTYKADGTGHASPHHQNATNFHYVNANELIRYQSYGTGAGAHSDIYRVAMGRMLWEFFDRPRQ